MREGESGMRGKHCIKRHQLRGAGLCGMRQGYQPADDCSHGNENAKPETDPNPAREFGESVQSLGGALEFGSVVHRLTLRSILSLQLLDAEGNKRTPAEQSQRAAALYALTSFEFFDVLADAIGTNEAAHVVRRLVRSAIVESPATL